MFAAGAGWVEAADDGGACGGADGGVGPAFGEALAAGGEGVDVGCIGEGVAVAAEVGAHVLIGDPEDVGLFCGDEVGEVAEDGEGE